MHLLDDHKINEVNDAIRIAADDRDPSNGNASHEYRLSWSSSGPPRPNDTPKVDGCDLLVRFQRGPLGETGPNGVTNEALLVIVADRLRGFQDGPYACQENQDALEMVEEAIEWLHSRTMRRVTAGVEGTSAIMEGEGNPPAPGPAIPGQPAPLVPGADGLAPGMPEMPLTSAVMAATAPITEVDAGEQSEQPATDKS